MNNEEKNKLISAWISYQYIPANKYVWSCETLDELVSEKPELAWKIILGILVEDQSDVVISNLAAGPLENLLARHGQDFVDRIDEQARKSGEFRFLLNGVWSSNIDSRILQQLSKYRTKPW